MFGKRAAEMVLPGAIGHEIELVTGGWPQDGKERRLARVADRSGRQADAAVRVSARSNAAPYEQE